MLDVIVGTLSAATLVLLGLLYRRIAALERREKARVRKQQLIDTPRPPTDEPEKRRRHLSLYRGGAAAALIAIGAAVRNAWRPHVSYGIASAMVTAGLATGALFIIGPDHDKSPHRGSAAPSPSATPRSSPPPQPALSRPTATPSTPTTSHPAQNRSTGRPTPPAPATPGATALPAVPPVGQPVGGAGTPPASTPVPKLSVAVRSDGSCVHAEVQPLLQASACPLNGR